MSGWTAADLPSFAGRTVIVTGANSGLGEVTARELARVGAQVILACRNTDKGDAAAAGMTGEVEVRKLDLQNLASVRAFADGVDAVDVLVNNAGIMAVPFALHRRRLREPDRHQSPRPLRADQSAAAQDHRPGGHGVVDAMHMFGYISLERPELEVAALFRVAGLRPVEAGQPAVHQRAAAPPGRRRVTAEGACRPPRLLRRPTCRATRATRSARR